MLLPLGPALVLFGRESLNSLTKWHHYLLMWFWLAWPCVCVCVFDPTRQAASDSWLTQVCLTEGLERFINLDKAVTRFYLLLHFALCGYSL